MVPLVPGYLAYLAALVGADAPAVSADEERKQGRWAVLGAARSASEAANSVELPN